MGYIYESAEKLAARRKEAIKAIKKNNYKLICDVYNKILDGEIVKLQNEKGEKEDRFVIFSLGKNLGDSIERDLEFKFLYNKVYKFEGGGISLIVKKTLKDEIADALYYDLIEVSAIKGDYDTLRYHLVHGYNRLFY